MTWWKSKGFKRTLWMVLGLPLALVALIIALQTFYALRPAPPLSDDAKRLQTIAAPYFTPNDAGYFALGLHAPEGMDPITVGKCLSAQYVERARAEAEKIALEKPDDAGNQYQTEKAATETRCGGGKAWVATRTIKPAGAVTRELIAQWSADDFVLPVIAQRLVQLDAMESGGFAWFGLVGTTGVVSHTTFIHYWRWLSARSASAYLRDDFQTFLDLQRVHQRSVMRHGRGMLVEAMIANSGVARNHQMIHFLATAQDRINASQADALRAALQEALAMPEAVAFAYAGEFGFSQRAMDHFRKLPFDSFEWKLNRLSSAPNDTANISASALAHFARCALSAKEARAARDTAPRVSTTTLGFDLGAVGNLLHPNPVERILTEIGIPQYDRYALRAHDAIAHANAIRVVIAAREQGIQNDAKKLKALIESAPADMRNPYTEKPFEFDPQNKTLSFERQSDGIFPGVKKDEKRIVVAL